MGTTTTKKQPAKLDWSLNPRGTVSATAQAIGATVFAAGIGDAAHVSPAFGMAAAGVGALGHLVVGAHRAHTPGAILYRLACWAGAGGWLTWTLTTHHHEWWNVNGLAALAVGAVGAGVMAPIAGRTRDSAGAPGRALVLRSAARAGEEWAARFRRVCRVNVEVTDVRPWATGAGYDVFGKLPPGGATLKQLRSAAEALATDADLPDGCGVEIEGGGSRATFVAHVSTVNRLVQTVDYPEDYSPRSIYDPIEIGEYRNSDTATVMLREDSAVVTGQKRSGKTNTLDVLTTGVGRCRDAIVMHIDMNGGGVSQAWLHPWLNGETDRPAVDWAASTPKEALFLTTVMLAVAKHRKSAYRTFKVESDDKLLRISPQLPEVVIEVDEGAESMGIGANKDPILKQVRDNLEEIQRIGGNEGINVIPSALRATQEMISPSVIKQARIRIGMLVQDTEELAYLFGWNKGIDPADLPGKGCGFLATGTDAPRPFKAYFMKPSQITRAAIAIARQRPNLDAASAEVADGEFEIYLGGRKPVTLSGLYSGRYDRMRAAFTGQAAEAPTEVAVPEPTEPAPSPAPAAGAPLRLVSATDWPDLRSAAPAAQERPRLVDASAWPDLSAAHGQLATAAPVGVLTAARPVPTLIRRALEVFDEADDNRMHTGPLAEALGLTPSRMAELLLPVDIRSLRNPIERGGKKLRGYAREDFAAAAERIACGELDVPPELADWTP